MIKKITPTVDCLSSIETPVSCPEINCGKIFMSRTSLEFHASQFHNHVRIEKKSRDKDVSEQYHCPVSSCIYNEKFLSTETTRKGKYFSKKKYLKQHYLKVHAERNLVCQQCGKKFSTHALLNFHLNACGLDLSCSCKQTFGAIEALMTHVRRTKHDSSSLSNYYKRMKKKKNSGSQNISCNANINISGASTETNKSVLGFKSPQTTIMPKPSTHPHIVAAIALSELALTGFKRWPSVDVGVQTDGSSSSKRISRKSSSSPIRSREPQGKRKLTIETETQTHLTNLKCKRRKNVAKNVIKCSIATDTLPMPIKSRPKRVHYENKCHQITLDKTPADGISLTNVSMSSGTQTSPRVQYSSSSLSPCDLSYNLFHETFSNSEVQDFQDKNFDSIDSDQRFQSGSAIINNDNNYDSLLSSTTTRHFPMLAETRSFSIETQTDVFLSSSDETDPLSIVETEQEMPSLWCKRPDPYSSVWCTSETQTCEEFSDIEKFLCSDIHTQTVEESSSPSELFPELYFTADNQTQTRLEEAPLLVTTHTQTVIDDQ